MSSNPKGLGWGTLILYAITIIIIAIVGLGAFSYYDAYQKYQPLIGYYNENTTAMNDYYASMKVKYMADRSSPYFLSDQWVSDFAMDINEYTDIGNKLMYTDSQLNNCPYALIFDTSQILTTERRYNATLQEMRDYYNRPKHTVEVWLDSNTYVSQTNSYTPLEIIEYRDATDPTYNQLINFMSTDKVIHNTYVPDQYVCQDFAVDLHNEAESNLIRAHLVKVTFPGVDNTHMIVLFRTVDRGDIYIDDTGNTAADKARGSPDIPASVNIAVGQSYTPQYLFPTRWYHSSIGIVAAVQQLS